LLVDITDIRSIFDDRDMEEVADAIQICSPPTVVIECRQCLLGRLYHVYISWLTKQSLISYSCVQQRDEQGTRIYKLLLQITQSFDGYITYIILNYLLREKKDMKNIYLQG